MRDPRLATTMAGLLAVVLAGPVFGQAVIDDRVTETADLPTWKLQHDRKRMLHDQHLSFAEMRALADAGDGLAAFRYANRLMALDDPSVVGDAALYYASAVFTGRDYALGPLIRILERPDLDVSDKRLHHLENAIRTLAVQGYTKAREALTGFYESGKPFGYHPERARDLLLELAESGDGAAAIQIGSKALQNPDLVAPERLHSILTHAASDADELGTRTAAKSILAQLDARSDDTEKETQ
ncbi:MULTISPECIES: hypothetical protein [Thioclava]|uniref:Uncharacterized protein n=1 Tax=Thioclava nitratireducens TaxID=1915078 RepID=A0ABN4X986_9RHOB|nr:MULTISPECIES: hypothetical protein [Thioclava]AQS48590.1 hypothetical protein BMG03_12890 [Thioclava nitratireducens]OWY04681.1 hypothetical protein B6V75_00575 [Thioclava sp. F1Mire-8]OWY06284.1 hypothetical protein B6V76_00290 [Thioclava sp. IC9]OWY07920.1 hypothetical protein B6V74_15180 [Thioclava sp. F42-5]OWY15085.1 hypothetical protein B6V72_00325 [Thioclava sp. F34-6]